MLKIYRRQLNEFGNLDEAIKKHLAALHAHSFTVGVPRPVAHPLVEACLTRVQKQGQPDQYIPDYEIVDDPTDAELEELRRAQLVDQWSTLTLEQKKIRLYQELHAAEAKARNQVVPQHKLRLISMKRRDAVVCEGASEELIKVMKDIEDVFIQFDWKGAYAEAEIGDLDESNIDDYKLPTFG